MCMHPYISHVCGHTRLCRRVKPISTGNKQCLCPQKQNGRAADRDVIETFPIPRELRSKNEVGAVAIHIWWMWFPYYLGKVYEVGASREEIQIDRRHQRLGKEGWERSGVHRPLEPRPVG